jgi:hypothetical protein
MMPILPPEARLLVLSTRAPAGDVDRELADLARQPLDWRFVGALAEREKLLPVLWNRIGKHATSLPDAEAERIRRQAAVIEFRMAIAETVLEDVIKRLTAAGIPVMLLKGAALATTVYASFAARPMGDLDVLVPPDKATLAWQLLVDAGWRKEFEGGATFYEGHHHLAALVDPKGLGIILEIHRAILPPTGPFLFDEAELWRDATAASIGTSEAWVPSRQHQLLHLSAHFAWSNMLSSGLGRTARDVAALLEAGPTDWESFVALALRTRAGTCAYWTLAMARALARAQVPPTVLERLRPRQPTALTNALQRALVASALLGACPSIRTRQWLWRAAILPGRSGHMASLPWQVEAAFLEAFPRGGRASLGARTLAHVRGVAAWLRFARIIGVPRPIT